MRTTLNQVVLLLVPLFTPPVWGIKLEPNGTSPCDADCFYESPRTCDDKTPKCMVSPSCSTAVVCCNLNDTNLLEYLNNSRPTKDVRYHALHIQNSDFKVFDIRIADWLKTLKSIAITNGHMNAFKPDWTMFTKVKCLNLSTNGLTQIGKLVTTVYLRTLDLSNNSLSEVPEFRANMTNISITIDMSGNRLSCDDLKSKLDQYKNNLIFANANKTWCTVSPSEDTWYKTTEQLMLSELEKMTTLSRCPLKNCTCILHRLEVSTQPDAQSEATVTLMIDCSNRGYQSLPLPLPENCISLNVSHNNIYSLDALHEPSYVNLRELHADHNNITSIDALEGSKFIQHFVRLNLRNNNIRSINHHLLKDAFDRASLKKDLSLGQNFVECDCHAAKALKDWLLLKDVRDHDEIYCLDRNDVKVIDLDPSELCREKQRWTDYIYYIIAAEVLLLTSLIAKVSYDYWVFKSTGYLPWPASKMPKLPCDWLCE